MGRLIAPTSDGFKQAGSELRAGKLIAFPTETVYGLGANALDVNAVLSIFQAKGRPLTDPLIVHVPTPTDARKLVQLDTKGAILFDILAQAFWPGPLTIIAKAVESIPLEVTANTGFVGVRCPKHPLAQKLLQEAGVPIAAPSANRFGHVSPTSARHVLDDLGDWANGSLGVIDDSNEGAQSCEIGIESTVIKLVPEKSSIVLYRRGGTSEIALQNVLTKNADVLGRKYAIDVISKGHDEKPDAITENNKLVGQEAPGQCITHYAPDVDTYLYRKCDYPLPDSNSSDQVINLDAQVLQNMDSWVVLDFCGQLKTLQHKVLEYRDLSQAGDVSEAAKSIFNSLRWAETVDGVKCIVICDVENHIPTCIHGEHTAALHDRMFRAASGKIRTIEFTS